MSNVNPLREAINRIAYKAAEQGCNRNGGDAALLVDIGLCAEEAIALIDESGAYRIPPTDEELRVAVEWVYSAPGEPRSPVAKAAVKMAHYIKGLPFWGKEFAP